MHHKTFHGILTNFSEDPQGARDALNDKRLSQIEKTIINGYLFLRDNKNQDVIDSLINTSEISEYLVAHKYLLMAMANNNLGNFKIAEEQLLLALKNFESSHPYFEFVTRLNLFINYLNSQQTEKMTACLKQLEKMKNLNVKTQIRLNLCRFFYYSSLNNFKNVEKVLKQIEELKENMTESDYIAHLVNVFSYAMRTDNMELGEETIVEIVKHRKYRTKENFKFMKTLFFHLTEGKPVYVRDVDYQGTPFLYHQIMVIHKLEALDREGALFYWKKLQEQLPEQYLPEFKYDGVKCLFSLCLNKHLSHVARIESPVVSDGNHLEILHHLFQNAKGPLSKEMIYESLWGRKPIDKIDMTRLSNTIFRYKQKYGAKIKTRKGCYSLVKAA